jgi:hypothetical protein
MGREVDQQTEEKLDDAFEDFLASSQRIQEEVAERCAKSGTNPTKVLFGIDRKARRVAIVPVDPPPSSEKG